jgi:ribosome-associated protein
MSRAYIQSELKKIIGDAKIEYPQNLAMASAWLLGNLKGINLKVLDTREMSSLADYFVMGSATNITQLQSMAEAIVSELKELEFNVRSVEGLAGADWVLIDLGDILVHIFLDSSRSIYDLDNLWSEAISIPIPSEYYFSSESDEAVSVSSNEDKDYF